MFAKNVDKIILLDRIRPAPKILSARGWRRRILSIGAQPLSSKFKGTESPVSVVTARQLFEKRDKIKHDFGAILRVR